MTRLMEIRKERGFPQPFAKPCWVSHISHRPDDDGVSSRQFNHGRQRPTLTKSIFCPTNGEPLSQRIETLALAAREYHGESFLQDRACSWSRSFQ